MIMEKISKVLMHQTWTDLTQYQLFIKAFAKTQTLDPNLPKKNEVKLQLKLKLISDPKRYSTNHKRRK